MSSFHAATDIMKPVDILDASLENLIWPFAPYDKIGPGPLRVPLCNNPRN